MSTVIIQVFDDKTGTSKVNTGIMSSLNKNDFANHGLITEEDQN
jgi:hypothetical protein